MTETQTQTPPSWSRAPFTPGNTLSTSHGAWSPRMFEPLAAELEREYVSRHPHLADFGEALAGLCRVEARALLIDRWLAEHGLVDGKGRWRDRPLTSQRQFEAQAAAYRSRLGLDPMSQARLALDQAQAAATASALPSVRDAGRAALAARGLAALPASPSGDAA